MTSNRMNTANAIQNAISLLHDANYEDAIDTLSNALNALNNTNAESTSQNQKQIYNDFDSTLIKLQKFQNTLAPRMQRALKFDSSDRNVANDSKIVDVIEEFYTHTKPLDGYTTAERVYTLCLYTLYSCRKSAKSQS